MSNSLVEEVVIGNPIGNLYRKNHVLVLVVDSEGNFILGKKKDFYPSHIARMLGGGIKDGEEPKDSARREIEEELGLALPAEQFNLLGDVTTKATTLEGDMQMHTWVYSAKVSDTENIKPSDDISGTQTFTLEQYLNLVEDMKNLSGEFATDKFSFLWSDWGKIYAPIHAEALRWYNSFE
jgi:8-oxo-dGTP pyrophosphatase MutT (NUDIX family)